MIIWRQNVLPVVGHWDFTKTVTLGLALVLVVLLLGGDEVKIQLVHCLQSQSDHLGVW